MATSNHLKPITERMKYETKIPLIGQREIEQSKTALKLLRLYTV
ncbi:hypothetical protein J2T13_002121 [Paenibacillus sp. DS2015]